LASPVDAIKRNGGGGRNVPESPVVINRYAHLQLSMSEAKQAQLSAPSSLAANSAFFLFREISRSFCPYRAGCRYPVSLASAVRTESALIQRERRASGEFVHVELAPGVVTILPSTMTRPPQGYPIGRAVAASTTSAKPSVQLVARIAPVSP
jgi:hypothetical protein